ncbi:hypothetical protein E4U53_006246 [Claviceps sorghi]|nr:hypothetical protein E4U53_006246 [Claviceps sorghi]
MCYFDQTRWSCGYWRWGHFRQQCNKEYRMGETCGLKLVYETKVQGDLCKICHDIDKKERRYEKMYRDVQRWQREGNRNATIERTCSEMDDIREQIYRMRGEHLSKLQSLGQVCLVQEEGEKLSARAGAQETGLRVSAKRRQWRGAPSRSIQGIMELRLMLSPRAVTESGVEGGRERRRGDGGPNAARHDKVEWFDGWYDMTSKKRRERTALPSPGRDRQFRNQMRASMDK